MSLDGKVHSEGNSNAWHLSSQKWIAERILNSHSTCPVEWHGNSCIGSGDHVEVMMDHECPIYPAHSRPPGDDPLVGDEHFGGKGTGTDAEIQLMSVGPCISGSSLTGVPAAIS